MANDPQTFSELQTTLIGITGRDDLLDEGNLPERIALAERMLQREVFLPEREAVTTLSATTGTVALPSDLMGIRTVYVDDTSDVVLVQVTPTKLRELYPTATTGTPRHFAIEAENMLLGPPPSQTTSIKLTYIQKFTPLSDAATTNYLLTDHPDLYVHACLTEIYEFFRDYEAATRERTIAIALIGSVNKSTRRRTNNSAPLTARSPLRQVNRYARA